MEANLKKPSFLYAGSCTFSKLCYYSLYLLIAYNWSFRVGKKRVRHWKGLCLKAIGVL